MNSDTTLRHNTDAEVFNLQPNLSERRSIHFQYPGSDIQIRSKDNVLFSLHRKNIETHALGFPPAEFESDGEVVVLEEDGRTLELLFKFMYPALELPDLEEIPFETLLPLAEAAEKYGVTFVIYICRKMMRAFVHENPERVLEYACKHFYPELVASIIPNMLKHPLQEVAKIASYKYFLTWARYMENWKNITLKLPRHLTDKSYCHGEMGRRLMHVVASWTSWKG